MARMVGRGQSGAAGPTVRGMPTFDRFLRYDELTAELQAMAASTPTCCRSSPSAARTRAATWLATVTDRATGPHDAKPAQWVDADVRVRSAGRWLSMISGETKPLPRLPQRALGTRNTRPVRKQAVSSRRSTTQPLANRA